MTDRERVSLQIGMASTGSDAAPSVSYFLNVCGVPGGQHSSGRTFGIMGVTVSTGFLGRTLGLRESRDVCLLESRVKLPASNQHLQIRER